MFRRTAVRCSSILSKLFYFIQALLLKVKNVFGTLYRPLPYYILEVEKMKKRIITIGILSLVITLLSPFIFYSYFEEQPETLTQKITFGGPVPFVEQSINLPDQKKSYPLEVKFESPSDNETKYKFSPFLFSYICYFLFLFAFYTIISRFFSGKQIKDPK